MRINWNYIKGIVLLALTAVMFAFGTIKNNDRILRDASIVFVGKHKLFLTHENVNNLLVQKNQSLKNEQKETLALNEVELALKSNKLVKNAEVSVSVDGDVRIEIEQKTPIARVITNDSYYVDDQGKAMPLSENYSARVPMVSGYITPNDLSALTKLAHRIEQDAFYKTQVVHIHANEDKTFTMRLRTYDFVIQLGDLHALDKKLTNFKAFYKEADESNQLNRYKAINLKFDNQVICTKK